MRLDRRHIETLIPHRRPFLFVESAEVVSPRQVNAVARWDATHPILAGHFPDFPIVPGVLLVEATAQAAGILVASNHRMSRSSISLPEVAEAADGASSTPWHLGVLTGIRRASFNKPVFANDAVDLTVTLGQALGNMMAATAEAAIEGHGVVFKGEFNIAVVDWSHLVRATP